MDKPLTDELFKIFGTIVMGLLVLCGRGIVYLFRNLLAKWDQNLAAIVSLQSRVAELEDWKRHSEIAISAYYKGSVAGRRILRGHDVSEDDGP